jgi:hypothetical protein
MDDTRLQILQDAVKTKFDCEVVWAGTTPVSLGIWNGEVQRYRLLGHPFASECFAWEEQHVNGQRDFVFVLKRPPILTPEIAVARHVNGVLEDQAEA